MLSPNGSIYTTHNPPPLSFYNTFKVWSLSFALGPEEKNVIIFFNTLYYYEKICCYLTNDIDTYSLISTYYSFL